ncbi:hypothetical protein BH23PLA1_BH23PLA1_22320 [soil metagenome]
MATLITDPDLEERLKRERQETGADRYDEVWEGMYMMSPLADNEHQGIVMGLTFALHSVVGLPGTGQVRPGVNVSDRAEDWTHNYRCPDVAVFLQGTAARDLGTHWLGGPDFAVEITSRDERTRAKLPFYSAVGTLELLIVDRKPWTLELYRLRAGTLELVGNTVPDALEPLVSEVVPLAFQLRGGAKRPEIEVSHLDSEQRWTV